MTWSCAVCRKQWETPDTVTGGFFHRCVAPYAGDENYTPRRLPLDREARGAFYYALFEQVGEDATWRK